MKWRMATALLALVGLFVAIYLMLYNVGALGALSCAVGSCERVQTSRWASFLGLPVAGWGVGFYAVVLALAVAGTTDRWAESRALSITLVVLAGWGVLFSAWLTYLELFVIRAICMWCVVSAVIALLLLVVAVLDLRELGREG